jgi:hypothetical protein
MDDPADAPDLDPSRRVAPIGWLAAVLALIGTWVLFLPFSSGTLSILGAFSKAATRSGVSTWQGQVCLAAYVFVLISVVTSASAAAVANTRLRWIAFIAASAAVVVSTSLLAVIADSASLDANDMDIYEWQCAPLAAAYAQPLIAVALAWSLLHGLRSHRSSGPKE